MYHYNVELYYPDVFGGLLNDEPSIVISSPIELNNNCIYQFVKAEIAKRIRATNIYNLIHISEYQYFENKIISTGGDNEIGFGEPALITDSEHRWSVTVNALNVFTWLELNIILNDRALNDDLNIVAEFQANTIGVIVSESDDFDYDTRVSGQITLNVNTREVSVVLCQAYEGITPIFNLPSFNDYILSIFDELSTEYGAYINIKKDSTHAYAPLYTSISNEESLVKYPIIHSLDSNTVSIKSNMFNSRLPIARIEEILWGLAANFAPIYFSMADGNSGRRSQAIGRVVGYKCTNNEYVYDIILQLGDMTIHQDLFKPADLNDTHVLSGKVTANTILRIDDFFRFVYID